MRGLLLAGASLLLVVLAGCAVPADRVPDAALQDTHWKLTHLANEPVTMTAGRREPHVVFDGKTGRLAGFGGCNRLLGTYKLNEDTVSLGPVASTRMACAEGSETEAKFLATLERVHFWKVVGQQLELFDSARALLARFEVRELK